MKLVIQKKILNELSRQHLSRTCFGMLLGKVQPKSRVMLDVFDDKVVFRAPRTEEAVALEN